MIRMGFSGSPDIIGMTPTGRFFGVEIKGPKGVQSDSQVEFEKKTKANCGLYFLVNNTNQIEEVYQSLI
jgi:hypothetical protein